MLRGRERKRRLSSLPCAKSSPARLRRRKSPPRPRPIPLRSDDGMLETLNGSQRTVLEVLSSEPMTADEVVAATGLSVPETLSVLTQLEIFGIIRIHAGHRFSR